MQHYNILVVHLCTICFHWFLCYVSSTEIRYFLVAEAFWWERATVTKHIRINQQTNTLPTYCIFYAVLTCPQQKRSFARLESNLVNLGLGSIIRPLVQSVCHKGRTSNKLFKRLSVSTIGISKNTLVGRFDFKNYYVRRNLEMILMKLY